MPGTLRADLSDGPFRADYDKALDLMRRGELDPEAELADATLHGTYSDKALRVARAVWLERMRREHNSAAVFSALLPQLMEAEASIDLKTAVLRMAMEELRHALLSAKVVELLGGEASLETALEIPPIAAHTACTPVEKVLRNLIFIGCINETVGVAILTEERELVREPAIEAVITQLIADEVGHSRIGWYYLGHVATRLDDEARSRTIAYLPYAFAYVEKELMDKMRPLDVSAALRDELNALGIAAPQDARELFYAAIENAVLPPLDGFGLHASEGWRRRGALK